MENVEKKPSLVLISGVAGAGRSVVINTLEDIGFYCIDHLPIGLISTTIHHILKFHSGKFAIGIDVSERSHIEQFLNQHPDLEKEFDLDLIFLTASTDVLLNRYNSTRRRHPLSGNSGDLHAAIENDKTVMDPVRKIANAVIDTSSFSPHFLSRQIEARYSGEKIQRQLLVTFTSFGFKYGSGSEFDSVYDVRFLKNPYFDPNLKAHNGLEKKVQDYILSDNRSEQFIDRSVDLLNFLLPEYFSEGKNYFRVGIGCTGGKHRSVFVAEKMARLLQEKSIPNIFISVRHRDINLNL